MRNDSEIAEVAAWTKSTIVASAAFRKLVEQYPKDEFLHAVFASIYIILLVLFFTEYLVGWN